jgi:hypothetical protein
MDIHDLSFLLHVNYMAAGKAPNVTGRHLVQLRHRGNRGGFSCCQLKVESTALGIFLLHPELLPLPLETGNSDSFRNIKKNKEKVKNRF